MIADRSLRLQGLYTCAFLQPCNALLLAGYLLRLYFLWPGWLPILSWLDIPRGIEDCRRYMNKDWQALDIWWDALVYRFCIPALIKGFGLGEDYYQMN